jgi:hypothetical protein
MQTYMNQVDAAGQIRSAGLEAATFNGKPPPSSRLVAAGFPEKSDREMRT